MVLTLVIDVSGSMAQGNRLELVKSSIGTLLRELDERDRVGIVVFESAARDVLEPVSATDLATLEAALSTLAPGSSTNVEHGLNLGYAMALRHLQAGATNCVALFSDGVANVGNTEAQTILRQVGEARPDLCEREAAEPEAAHARRVDHARSIRQLAHRRARRRVPAAAVERAHFARVAFARWVDRVEE